MASAIPHVVSAELLAEDHFMVGDDPAAGEYQQSVSRDKGVGGRPSPADTRLVWQWTNVPGFLTTEWEGFRGRANPHGMSYPGLLTRGGMAQTDSVAIGERIGRSFDPELRFTAETEGTYYLSFLIMLGDHGGTFGYRSMELHDDGFHDRNRTFQIGVHRLHARDSQVPGDGDFGPGDGGWGVRVNNDKNLRFQFANQDRLQTEPNLFVVRFDMRRMRGGDSVTVWMNPDPESFGKQEPEGGRTLSGFDLTFDRISFATWENRQSRDLDIGNVFFDEIRLGTSWAAVTPPIPEGDPEEDLSE